MITTPDIIDSIVTIIVGSVALIVYLLSKRHEKRSAATIIIMDIRHAENVVLSILEKGFVDINTKNVLQENNWSKYKHLFAADFSQDDYASFNRFFDSCVEMADARNRLREVFYSNLTAKAQILQNELFKINSSPSNEEERKRLIDKINQESCVFDPSEPRDRMIRNLQLMGRLSNTIAFEKLKSKAGIKS